MRWAFKVLAAIVGFTTLFYTLFCLSFTLLSIYHPMFKGIGDKVNIIGAIQSLVVFVSLILTATIYAVIIRFSTGHWPMAYDAKREIDSLKTDINGIRDSVNDIKTELKDINRRLVRLEQQNGQTRRARRTTRENNRTTKKKET